MAAPNWAGLYQVGGSELHLHAVVRACVHVLHGRHTLAFSQKLTPVALVEKG